MYGGCAAMQSVSALGNHAVLDIAASQLGYVG